MILQLATILIWSWCGWIWYCTWHSWQWHKRAMKVLKEADAEFQQIETRLGTPRQLTREEVRALVDRTNAQIDESTAYGNMSKYWSDRAWRPWAKR